jgi:hypothetical protein
MLHRQLLSRLQPQPSISHQIGADKNLQKKNLFFLKKSKPPAAPVHNRRIGALTKKKNLKNVVFVNTVLEKKRVRLCALFVLRVLEWALTTVAGP